MGKTIIEIKDLRREFKMGGETLHVLKGIDLNIYEGEFVTIMGPSGSGKSTLLNILGCLDRPTSGDYILDGISVRNMSKNSLANVRNTKIGFIFQAYNLLAACLIAIPFQEVNMPATLFYFLYSMGLFLFQYLCLK